MKSIKKIIILNLSFVITLIILGLIFYYYHITSEVEFVEPNYITYSYKKDRSYYSLPKLELKLNFKNQHCIINQNINIIYPHKNIITFDMPKNIAKINNLVINNLKYQIKDDKLYLFLTSNDTIVNFSINYTIKIDNINFHNVKQKDFWALKDFYVKPQLDENFNFYLKVKVHKNYLAFSNLTTTDYEENNDSLNVHFIGDNYSNAVLFLSRNIIVKQIKLSDGIFANLYYQNQNKKYEDILISTIKNYYKTVNKYIGMPKNNVINIADIPITSVIDEDFDNLVTLKLQKYNYFNRNRIKDEIIDKSTSQFFKYYIDPSNQKQWKTNGLTKFIANKIKEDLLGKPIEKINLFSIVEVNGINYLSFLHIPIIYTLGNYEKNYYTASLMQYFKSSKSFNISDNLDVIKDIKITQMVNETVPELYFHTVYNFIGVELFNKIKYLYQQDKIKNNFSYDIINDIYYSYPNLRKTTEDIFYSNKACNYKISNVRNENDKYFILVENEGDASVPVDFIYFTDKGDTLQIPFNYKKKWSVYEIYSKDKILAFVLDSKRKNILDFNYSDNSFLTDKTYYGALTISSRMFFYIENFLIVLGSIG